MARGDTTLTVTRREMHPSEEIETLVLALRTSVGTPGASVACLGLALTLTPWCAHDSALGSRKFKSVQELRWGVGRGHKGWP